MTDHDTHHTEDGSESAQRSDVYTARPRDARGESFLHGVVEAVSEVTGKDPLGMRPLYETVDMDTFDRLFDSNDTDPRSPTPSVTFRFEGCLVTVSADGRTAVVPPERDGR